MYSQRSDTQADARRKDWTADRIEQGLVAALNRLDVRDSTEPADGLSGRSETDDNLTRSSAGPRTPNPMATRAAARRERICMLARPKQPRIQVLDKQKHVAIMRADRLRRAAAIANRRLKLASDNVSLRPDAQLLDDEADMEYKKRTLHARWLHASRVYEQARQKTEIFLLSMKNDALFNHLTESRASAAPLPPI